MAVNPLLLAAFEPESVQVDANTAKKVQLLMHPAAVEIGSYEESIVLYSGRIASAMPFTITVMDEMHPPAEIALADINSTDGCLALGKPAEGNIYFTLSNTTAHEQTVKVVPVSDVVTAAGEKYISLAPFASAESFITVTSRATDEAGKHDIEINVFNDEGSAKATACTFLNSISLIELTLDRAGMEMAAGEASSFVILLENNGDLNENVGVFFEADSGLNFIVKNFAQHMAPGEAQQATIVVSADRALQPGMHEVKVKLQSFSGFDEKTLRLHVTGKGILKFESYPDKVQAAQGSLVDLVFTLNNPTAEDVTVALFSESNDVSFSKEGIYLAAGTSRNVAVKAKIADNAAPGLKAVKVRMQNADYDSTQVIAVEVKDKAQGFLSGLVLLEGSLAMGLIVFAFLLALQVFVRRKKIAELLQLKEGIEAKPKRWEFTH